MTTFRDLLDEARRIVEHLEVSYDYPDITSDYDVEKRRIIQVIAAAMEVDEHLPPTELAQFEARRAPGTEHGRAQRAFLHLRGALGALRGSLQPQNPRETH